MDVSQISLRSQEKFLTLRRHLFPWMEAIVEKRITQSLSTGGSALFLAIAVAYMLMGAFGVSYPIAWGG